MANNLYPKLDMNTNDQLGHLLTVFLVRACYNTTGSYKDRRIPRRWRKCKLSLSDGLRSRSKTLQSLCKSMKLNLFSTDVCTKTIKQILDESPTALSRTVNCYIASLCTGREFLAAFYTSGNHLTHTAVPLTKIKQTLHYMNATSSYHRCFTRSFNPQRTTRNMFLKYKRLGFQKRPARMFKNMFCSPMAALRLKNNQAWCSKRNICKTIRSYHGLGVFGFKFLVQHATMRAVSPEARSNVWRGGAWWQDRH